jgi:hypothetical protein
MVWISNDTIDSVLRQREEGREKDLSAPLYGVRYCCPSLTMFGVSWQIFVEVPDIQIHENASVGSQADTCGRVDMTKHSQSLYATHTKAPKTRIT